VLSAEANAAADRALGEALSMISFYDFTKVKGTSWLSDAVEIRTAFVTGDAAIALNAEQSQKVYVALAARAIPTDAENAKEAIANATNGGFSDELRTLAAIQWADLTPVQKKRAGRITGVNKYSEPLHIAIRKELGIQ
jgi:hypothetical protein